MLDKVRSSSGKIYLNGTLVVHANSTPKKSIVDVDSRNRTKRSYKISFKAKQKIYDAITYQNHTSVRSSDLHHCFLTLTFRGWDYPTNPNPIVTSFFDRWKKRGARNYTWIREVGKRGSKCHYHATVVAPYLHISEINRVWCDCRGSFSANAVRTAPGRGMVIRNVIKARQYVAKYMTKASTDDQKKVKGRVYAVSNDLIFDPLSVDAPLAYSLMHDQYRSTGWTHRGDFATVGQIKADKSVDIYSQVQEILKDKSRDEKQREYNRLLRKQRNDLKRESMAQTLF